MYQSFNGRADSRKKQKAAEVKPMFAIRKNVHTPDNFDNFLAGLDLDTAKATRLATAEASVLVAIGLIPVPEGFEMDETVSGLTKGSELLLARVQELLAS